MKSLVVSFLLSILAIASVSAKNVVKVYVSPTPRMHCESCEQKIRKALQFEKGMKDMVFDVQENILMLEFDQDKTSLEKLAKRLAKIGYTLEIINPETIAKSNHDANDNCCGHEKKSSCLSIKKK